VPQIEPELSRTVATLSGVGPRLAEKLARLGVDTIADLLCLLPQRYEDRTEVRPLGGLSPGEKVLVEGRVELAEIAFRRRRSLLCRIADGSGVVTLRFFHFSNAQHAQLDRGTRLRCFGEVRAGPTGLEMVHPEYSVISGDEPPLGRTLTPVYPSTEGLHQQRLRRLIEQALERVDTRSLTDYLADQLDPEWPSLHDALTRLHRPPRDAKAGLLAEGRDPSRRRLAVEELVAHRLSLRQAAVPGQRQRAAPLANANDRLEALRAALPFRLTAAQLRAIDEIGADLAVARPMHRLLQGDVGSGKTVVAAAAALTACAAGYQAALMAPTELLAEQHFANLDRWLGPLGIDVALLTGSVTGAIRNERLDRIANGSAQLVVGTHALFQDAIRFRQLALVVVDEQHRFGVHQRFMLKRKGQTSGRVPHQLIMTATPIPRTLAMTVYADLDCSVIDGLPAGRKPVRTAIIPERRRPELVRRVRAHCAAGRQAYWVCPLIEESDVLESSAAAALQKELSAALPDAAIGLIHGRMRPADKERVMRAFKAAELDLLVATTVIEVGVDVPNATLMVIENAERMGLAQLHQLRGRVGRGEAASTCVLLYKAPLSEMAGERLKVLRETSDGFDIAEKDMQLRGPGDVLGTKQTGALQFRVADLLRDADLLPLVVRVSEQLQQAHPERVPLLIRRWVRTGTEYAKV
jgi:ATP-dependent DNA helicase RecG